jgi:hypothetical protein
MDITNAIMDQELGRSAFTVERLTYTRTATGTSSRSATHQAIGCIHPGTPEIPPPNAPITLEGGWMRNPVSGKPTYIKGKFDTCSLNGIYPS